ncbi:MAG TPA: hypothetical protein VK469_02175 [Candidatus Kapabacteria bacterium]|nr:hypothetical protein [Candidatus Kapabacteria bacterium]
MPDTDNKKLPGDDFISANHDIDVEEIMSSIKKKIQDKKKSGLLLQKEIEEIENMELLPVPDILDIPYVYEPHLFPDSKGHEFKPFQLDPEPEPGLVKKILKKIRPLILPFLRFMIRPYGIELKNLSVQLHNLNKLEIHNLKKSIYGAYQTKEYIVLLHQVSNRLIMEASRMKIENELLKTKLKVLEDKIEFLENRERQIEKKLFNAGVGEN